MQIEVFRRYYDPIEANIVMNKLHANDINCFLTNENATSLLWHLSIAHGGINLMMNKKDFMKANLILDEKPLEIEELESAGPRCPECKSNNVAFGTPSKKRVNWIQLIVSFLFVVTGPVTNKAYHCFNCGNEFKLEERERLV
jgi:DNA-directed RNA polymerase subunit RPC12/RpoP